MSEIKIFVVEAMHVYVSGVYVVVDYMLTTNSERVKRKFESNLNRYLSFYCTSKVINQKFLHR
jgi:hypothetical protein